MGMPRRHDTSSSVIVISPTGRWNVLAKTTHFVNSAEAMSSF